MVFKSQVLSEDSVMKVTENLKNKIKMLIAININLIFKFICKLLKTKDYWIIVERGYDARDNAYYFYEYMKREHPEQKVYYIIDSKSADYQRVKEDAIEYKSLKTIFRVYRSEKIISTHYGTAIYNLSGRYIHLPKINHKFYFLQHGIIKDNIIGLHFKNAPKRLFICGAYPEYQYVKETYGYPDGIVRYTGLARFDNLHNFETKKQILVMPTWRSWCDTDFKNSEYFKCWNEFLNNQSLINYLENNNVQLIFYPHYEVQKHLSLFSTKSDKIILASFEDYDVQTLLKESAVLVTDYSSVYFDFAYMKKPVIYYQFDKERFFSHHYNKGYFDYETMGFGKVCESETEVINELNIIIQDQLKLNSYYLKRTENFFPLYDDKNCERIYNAIVGKGE